MKYFNKSVLYVCGILIGLLLVVALVFRVDDMTLAKGEVYDFNENWVLSYGDGETISIEQLPYLGKSSPGELLTVENTIPEKYYGMTMSFLSADKTLKVWMDGECVYTFGVEDERLFGHTPGSVVNFIDIPLELTEGKIRIEMCSPYPDYGARVSSVTVGDRDILVLKLLKDNLFKIGCNILILICGLLFFMIRVMKRITKQSLDGVQYLCGYCIVAAIYYFIETKTLHIFYGNQTLYSVLVFFSVMMIPFFVCLYFGNSVLGVYKRRWTIMLGLICANIGVQLILQLFNLVDFMNMAFMSHGLVMLTVIVSGKSYLDILKDKNDVDIRLGMIALLFMGLGGAVDIVRMYIVAVGDMGKYSRLGTVFFSVIMLYQQFSQLIKGYSRNMEENARLLQNEMEFMEKKNEQLRKANELAEEARQEAIAANAAKGKFLAHMSHEIRTPINAVLGMDTMILRETKDMQIKEYALDIQTAGQNLLSLINDILDFSKIESGKMEIVQVEYDFSSMIHDISNMVKAKAEGKKLKLNIFVEENIPSKMLGDDVRIRQVLVNLLNNAVKYTIEGSVTLRVKGRIEGRKAILDFAVEDTGIGIKEEDIVKLFQEFERIEEKRNRNVEGTGLGMNITTQLLFLMGSKINVESVYGKGSRFFFTLEQQIVDSTPIGNLEERIQKQTTEYNYMAAFTAPEANILVVDDNLTNHKVIINLLKRTKVNIDVADRGKTCLEMVTQKHYDMIFLDHMMPEMDGVETIHHMKELKNNLCEGTPVVALTANAITGAKEMYLAEGFDAFLPKPVNPDKLEQMIIKFLPRELLQFSAEEAELEGNDQPIVNPDRVLDELPIVDGIDWSYGFLHLPEKELLLETVADFYKAIEIEAESLEKFYREMEQSKESLTQYRIKVHAMKSSANMIGAIVLGGMAKVLENAAREADMVVIDHLHEIFIKEWRSYKEELKLVLPPEITEPSSREQVTDVELILSYLEELRAAMEDMDIDEMDRVIALLETYQYPSRMQSCIEKLSVYVVNMDVEQADSQIEELTTLMKNNEEWRN